MTEMFGEAWSPMSVPDLAPDDDDDDLNSHNHIDIHSWVALNTFTLSIDFVWRDSFFYCFFFFGNL